MKHEENQRRQQTEDKPTETESQNEETVEPSNSEPDIPESHPYDETMSDIQEKQVEEPDASEKKISDLPKRGPRFRRQLLDRFPMIDYPDTLEPKELDSKSWLDSIINLKASDYLISLQKLVDKRNL